MLLAETYQKYPIEINSAEAVAGTSQIVVDESDPVNVEDKQDVGDIREMQPMGGGVHP